MFQYSLTWSEEDKCYIATVTEFPNLSAFGKTRQEALKEAETAVDAFIEVLKEDSCEIPKPIATLNK